MKLLDWLFPPKILRYDSVVIVSPDAAALRSMSESLNAEHSVQFFVNCKMTLNGRTIHLADDEMAMALLQRRWWTNRPAVTVAILRNVR